MNWLDILKTDPCTLQAKEKLYRVLEKMGANNDLLSSFKDLDGEELRGMIEEFSTTAMEGQKPMFKQMLREWDMCLVQEHRNPNAPPVSSDHSQESMMYKTLGQKYKKIVTPEFRQSILDAIEENITPENELTVNREFYVLVQGKYKENLVASSSKLVDGHKNRIGTITQHVNYKATPERISGAVGRYLASFGFSKIKSRQENSYSSDLPTTRVNLWKRT